MAALPIWDQLDEFEETGAFPSAWKKAQDALSEISRPFRDDDCDIMLNGTCRVTVDRKPS